MKRAKDFREYIDALKALNEIQEIDVEVDWNLEIGAITRRSYELRAAAPLFNKISGCEKGFRVLGAPIGLSGNPQRPYTRIALSLGLPADAKVADIIETMAAWETQLERIPLNKSGDAPCKENKFVGEDVDLLRFPSPLIHDGDGGRYFGTLAILVTQSPDKKWTNWSVHRCMLQGKNKLNVNFPGGKPVGKHASMIYAMWQNLNKPMPCALVQGVDPLILLVSGMPLPDYVSEGEILGGYLGQAIDVVPCETIDLEVPASAEIVVEGFIGPADLALEGPMGEYTGYLTPNSKNEKPLLHVTGITHRNNPILPVCAAGEPPEENHTVWATGIAASILGELRKQDFPVTTCFIPFESAVHWLVVTVNSKRKAQAHDPDSHEFVRELGEAIFKTRGGISIPKAIIVHDDIDPANIAEVVWAFATRCHPGIGEIHFEHLKHNPLEVFLHTDEKNPPVSTKTVYNCLFQGRTPSELPKRSAFRHIYPQELQAKVLANWTSYGY